MRRILRSFDDGYRECCWEPWHPKPTSEIVSDIERGYLGKGLLVLTEERTAAHGYVKEELVGVFQNRRRLDGQNGLTGARGSC
jgi:hypothetical protein